MSSTRAINYRASPVVSRFLQDEHFIRGIMGPVGSGKSVGCTVALYQLIRAFEVMGLPSRWVVVRNTYRELEDTTRRTYEDWLGHYGTWREKDLTHTIEFTRGRKHDVLFRALDRPQDIGKLLSLEISGAWLNEVREIPKAVYDMVQSRIGRYPQRKLYGDDVPPFSLIMDSNPMDDFHWYHALAEDLKPANARFFRQPGGLDPGAENVENLPPNYYQNIVLGKDEAWVKVYVDGEYGFAVDGKPVWPAFRDSRHIAPDLAWDGQSRLIVGIDFGLTPAAVVIQQAPTGQYQVLAELVTEDVAADEFAALLKSLLHRRFPGAEADFWGDPAGSGRAQTDKRSPFMILEAEGIHARPANASPKNPNDFDVRVKAVSRNLLKLDMAAEPALVVSDRCKYLRRALAGGYKYRQLQVSGDERYNAEPEKNIYSHVAEALQYGMIGAGQGAEALGVARHERVDYRQFNRRVI